MLEEIELGGLDEEEEDLPAAGLEEEEFLYDKEEVEHIYIVILQSSSFHDFS